MVCGDFEDWDAFVRLIGEEVHRQFSEGATEVWMRQAVRTAAQEMGCDEDDAWDFAADASGDIWAQVSETITVFQNFVDGEQFRSDFMCALRFGNGFVYVGLASNSERGINDDRIIAELALDDFEGLESWAQEPEYLEPTTERSWMSGDAERSRFIVERLGDKTPLHEPKRSRSGVHILVDINDPNWREDVTEAYVAAAEAMGIDFDTFGDEPIVIKEGL